MAQDAHEPGQKVKRSKGQKRLPTSNNHSAKRLARQDFGVHSNTIKLVSQRIPLPLNHIFELC